MSDWFLHGKTFVWYMFVAQGEAGARFWTATHSFRVHWWGGASSMVSCDLSCWCLCHCVLWSQDAICCVNFAMSRRVRGGLLANQTPDSVLSCTSQEWNCIEWRAKFPTNQRNQSKHYYNPIHLSFYKLYNMFSVLLRQYPHASHHLSSQ